MFQTTNQKYICFIHIKSQITSVSLCNHGSFKMEAPVASCLSSRRCQGFHLRTIIIIIYHGFIPIVIPLYHRCITIQFTGFPMIFASLLFCPRYNHQVIDTFWLEYPILFPVYPQYILSMVGYIQWSPILGLIYFYISIFASYQFNPNYIPILVG